jgi:2-octaprenylphenol hydroxylase
MVRSDSRYNPICAVGAPVSAPMLRSNFRCNPICAVGAPASAPINPYPSLRQIRDNAPMPESNTSNPDIVISGGGMVGLSMALALADIGLKITLLDPGAPQPPIASFIESRGTPDFDSRVSALTPASVAFLDRMGAWPLIESVRTSPYLDMQVWEADGSGAIQFSADEIHVPSLGHIVENRLITAALAEVLATKYAVNVRYGTGLSGRETDPESGTQILQLTGGSSLACKLLIGADGGRSRVRDLAGFRTRSWSYHHQAIVCTVRTEKDHLATAWQRFMRSGPVAFLPLALPGEQAQHYCSIVWSCEQELAVNLQKLDANVFESRLSDAIEHKLGRVELVSKVQAFPLRQQHATRYVQDGVALVGDAAHTIHPLAGQGVNLGLADAACLDRVIRAAIARGEPWTSEQVLSRYQRERKPANLGMMLGMEGFKRAFGSNDLLVRWLRNTGLRVADSFTPLKHELVQRAMGVK